jgi:hypothetical protein
LPSTVETGTSHSTSQFRNGYIYEAGRFRGFTPSRHGDLPLATNCTGEHSPVVVCGRRVGGEGSPTINEEVKRHNQHQGQRRARIAGDEEGADRTIRRVAPRQAQS